jgi:hypothetical protein
MKPHVEYWDSSRAARYLGFVKADDTPNMDAFKKWLRRQKPPVKVHKLGPKLLRFRQVDLDRCLEVRS